MKEQIKVTRDATVVVSAIETRHYAEGWQGAAPKEHADQLVAAGAAERLDEGKPGSAKKEKVGDA